MDWSLIIFIVVIGLFAWRGYRSGFIKSLGRVCAVLAGYGAAILFSGQMSAWVEAQFGLQGVVAFLAASLSLFFGAGLAIMLIFALLRRFVFPGDEIGTTSAVGGGLVGGLIGALLAIAIVWTFAFVRDMRAPAPVAEAPAREASSAVETIANRLAGGAIGAAMNAGSAPPQVAQMSSVLAASPVEVTRHAQQLMASPELQALIQDPRNRRILDSGRPELVRKLPAFRALAANPDLLALAEMAGIGDSGDLEAELAQQLTDTWGRAQRVQGDPRVQAILADPGFREALNSGNPIALLTNQKLLELADIVFADDAAGAAPNQATSAASGSEAPEAATQVYQWTDSSGRVHFSDTRPED